MRADDNSATRPRPSASRLGLTAAALAVTAVVFWQTAHWARILESDRISERSHQTLSLIVGTLRGGLDKHRYLPQALAADEALLGPVLGTADADAVMAVNIELERLNQVSGALDIYLMNAEGLTVAASNWNAEKTFLGRTFDYRPYFQSAMQGRLGRFFALGTTSGERGYYFAYPVRDGPTPVGALVVKLPVDHHEIEWRSGAHEVVVVDRDGVIFLSTVDAWRFKTLAALTPEQRVALSVSRRYGAEPLAPLQIKGEAAEGARLTIKTDGASFSYLVAEESVPEAEWRVLLLAPTGQIDAEVRRALMVAAAIMLSVLLASAAVYQRRRRLADRIAVQEQANAELEARVRQRTDDLTRANVDLQREVAERKRAEDEVRKAQAGLVQATKLAALGQMSAGLSHELNQPLGAIRSYADNARGFLDRDRPDVAKENLSGISELTERMARIVRNLRTYARDERVELRPTPVAEAVRESLALLDVRLRNSGVDVHTNLPDHDVEVIGGTVRLQQIFVNLISNAADAVSESDIKIVTIDVEAVGETVVIRVHDTGPGIPGDLIDTLFDPFVSTKEVGKGTGLGLSITFGLVSQFGGSIDAANKPDGGAQFTVTLRRAPTEAEAVA